MGKINLSSTTVVFDLDDTLYPEADYVASGIRYICQQIFLLFGKDITPLLQDANSNKDWLAAACKHAGLPQSAKESLLWMYRLHFPDICLSPDCKSALRFISKEARAVAILTDGRSITQRMKLKALGLGNWPAFISEDYGSEKPDPRRFEIIEKRYPSKNYIYIGDNLKKDFLGCNPRGWISIGVRANGRNIHPQDAHGLPVEAMPHYWINGWNELLEIFGCEFDFWREGLC